MTGCPIHGRFCHRLCRNYQKSPASMVTPLTVHKVRSRDLLPVLKRARVRRIDAGPGLVAAQCPVHQFRRHPRICRFCRADTRAIAPPLAPSEDGLRASSEGVES